MSFQSSAKFDLQSENATTIKEKLNKTFWQSKLINWNNQRFEQLFY